MAPGFAARTEQMRHMNAAAKMDMLQDMIEERVAVRRMKERKEKWGQYNAATVIKVRPCDFVCLSLICSPLCIYYTVVDDLPHLKLINRFEEQGVGQTLFLHLAWLPR